ncbi:hypothetical protein RUND412_004158 [Rhizina undulata]
MASTENDNSLSLASTEFLDSIQALFPADSALVNPWFYIAAMVYAANNLFAEAAAVYAHALKGISASEFEKRVEMTRKYREALFKVNVIYGAPRMINTLLEVNKLTPPELNDHQMYRNPNMPLGELTSRGHELFAEYYGASTDSTLQKLGTVHPDFLYMCITLVYGPIYAFNEIITKLETSFCLIGSLIAISCPVQIGWHLDGALRNGATVEEVQAVREMAIRVMRHIGKDVGEIPEVPREKPKRSEGEVGEL